MTSLSPGKIFLSDQRGITQTSGSQRHSTFNFDGYFNEHRQPLGNLYAFNDEVLAGLQSVETVVAQTGYVILIPVTGALKYTGPQGYTGKIDAGDVCVIPAPAQSKIVITNPYEGDHINYLQIHIKAGELNSNSSAQLFSFDLLSVPNELLGIIDAVSDELPLSLSIGLFAGRKEALYHPKDNSLLFAFALAGAFEMQGRLLHERDGLALWGAAEADMEALSNNAVMLLIELPAGI